MNIPILIVDDNKVDRYVLKRHLKKTGYDFSISEASDGAEALAVFDDYESKRTNDPDNYPPLLIFLDINMPKVDGFDFLERFSLVRKEHRIESTVVIMFTSSPLQEDKDKSFQFDFVKEYIVKGDYSELDLTTAISKHAESEQGAE